MIYPIFGARLPKPGSQLDYLYPRTPEHKHRGLDFPAPRGTPVLAVEPGTIEHINTTYEPGFAGYGRTVVLKSKSGRWYLYAHLGTIAVIIGQVVAQGDKIGTVGTSIFSEQNPTLEMTGPSHLHWEVSPRPYPQPSEAPRLNPRTALEKAPVIEYPEQPTISPRQAARRLQVLSAKEKLTIAVSAGILVLIWLLTMMRR